MAEPTENPPRGPTNLRIKFRSASLDQFIERYAIDVSRGGIFIRTREPLSVGTRLKLEFQLQDAAPLLAGEGTVVWIREPDPMRENVTPGMGVRFDKLTPESQPTLEKILAEKTRLQQSGGPPTGLTKTGGGMAVRRTSGIFPAVDAAGLPKIPSASTPPIPPATSMPSGTPMAPATPLTPAKPSGTADPTAPAPRPASPFASVSKTSFMASRPVTPAAPATPPSTGGPLRARTTTGSGVRPAPVPSALFEPPTADDIDKALEALHETSGSHVPPPISPAPDAPASPPAPDAPRFVSDDASNEPTRVVDVVEELVGGSAGHPPALPGDANAPSDVQMGAGAGDHDVAPSQHLSGQVGSAAALDAPMESELPDVEPAQPLTPEPRVHRPGRIPKQGGVAEPVVAEKSTRFRAASSAYPTLQRQRRKLGLAIVVIGGLAIAAVLKLPWRERLFPSPPAPTPAPVAEVPAPAVPAPPTPTPAAADGAPSAAVQAAPEGAGGAAAVKVEPGAPSAPPPPAAPVAAGEAAQEKPAPALAGKAANGKSPSENSAPAADDHAPPKHAGIHRRTHDAPEASGEAKGPAGGATAATEQPAAAKASGAKIGGEKIGGEKAGSEKAGGQKAGDEKPAEKAGDDKAAPAAASPAEAAAPPSPPPPVLKITSTPTGAEVLIDGTSVGYTPFSSKAIDPAAPHAITVKKDGYESTERMIGGLDWSRPRGNSPPSLKFNVKLRRTAPAPNAAPSSPKENGEPADDSGGPYIKEIKPDSP